jgi:Antitoxin Xre/MbcA/ParS C-terminal toxin-binding domain
MQLVNQALSQTAEPWLIPQGPEISPATFAVSGVAALLGTPYVAPTAPSLLARSSSPQSVLEQPAPQPTTILLPGRTTGPVRLIKVVAGAWAMTNDELASLLAYPSPQLAGDLVAGRLTFGGNEDRQDRARLIYLIHSTLSDLFLDPDQERRWVRTPNSFLNGETPLNVMLARRIPGMLTVREIVERHLANRR